MVESFWVASLLNRRYRAGAAGRVSVSSQTPEPPADRYEWSRGTELSPIVFLNSVWQKTQSLYSSHPFGGSLHSPRPDEADQHLQVDSPPWSLD